MSTHFFGLTDWTFSYSHSIGRNEFAGTGFRNPVDLALGADDVVYVLNRSYETRPDGIRVSVCTLNEEYISEFGSNGEGDGQFTWPTAIALDKDENVYVADEWLNRISIFNKTGEYLRKWGTSGSGDFLLLRFFLGAFLGDSLMGSSSVDNSSAVLRNPCVAPPKQPTGHYHHRTNQPLRSQLLRPRDTRTGIHLRCSIPRHPVPQQDISL